MVCDASRASDVTDSVTYRATLILASYLVFGMLALIFGIGILLFICLISILPLLLRRHPTPWTGDITFQLQPYHSRLQLDNQMIPDIVLNNDEQLAAKLEVDTS